MTDVLTEYLHEFDTNLHKHLISLKSVFKLPLQQRQLLGH